MATLTGVLLDVSGSMKQTYNQHSYSRPEPWARSIFKATDNLIKHDVSENNHVFAIGFGTQSPNVPFFDLIGTVKDVNDTSRDLPFYEAANRVCNLLESNGAGYIRKWASLALMRESVSDRDVNLILKLLNKNPTFLRLFVSDCLPHACREPPIDDTNIVEFYSSIFSRLTQNLGTAVVSKFKQANEEDIKEVIRKANKLMIGMDLILIQVSSESIFGVHEASDILHGCVGEDELTDRRAYELIASVEPYIYGATPFFSSLQSALKLFISPRWRYSEHKKLLFVLSDGMPSDGKNNAIDELKRNGVTIVCCYITKVHIADPMHLYSTKQPNWDEAAKLMFNMSSTVQTQMLPRTIFVKRHWTIDFKDNEVKLFVQVNHPNIIDDVCSLARDVVCSQDTLSDVLSSVTLDHYINQCCTQFEAKEQEGGTCYANAVAAVVHLATKRIIGRDEGYPDFFALRDEMIKRCGEGANTEKVLEEICPRYRLRHLRVKTIDALKAVAEKRPVVARFELPVNKMCWLINSYPKPENKHFILTKQRFCTCSCHPASVNTMGHAVVLTSFDSQGLRFMNSWGSDWGDMGFFTVENAKVLNMEFFDVYWLPEDLSQKETDSFDKNGEALMSRLKGLQQAKYRCPECMTEQLVTAFKGNLISATCPNCSNTFRCDQDVTGDLALNIYLTSLCHTEKGSRLLQAQGGAGPDERSQHREEAGYQMDACKAQ